MSPIIMTRPLAGPIASAFKPNGISGIAPGLINAPFAHALGVAFGSLAAEHEVSAVVVGRDCRMNGVELGAALQAGIRATGVSVIDVGLAPTPLVHFAAFATGAGTAICVTGGHLPAAYNGFSIMLDHRELVGAPLMELHERMTSGGSIGGLPGARTQSGMKSSYIARVLGDISLGRPMKIALDCGNGMASALAPELVRALGCDVTDLFCEMDGDFPHHLPDPADKRNLQDLIYCLRYSECEIGLAFDGDADRVIVVTKAGDIVQPDQLLAVLGCDLLAHKRGAVIVHDVQAGRNLPSAIQAAGGATSMWHTGRAAICERMDELDADVGGDSTGHLIFKDRWYGFSDGIYAAARLLEILSRHPVGAVETLLNALPAASSTPELRALTGAVDPRQLIETLHETAVFAGANEIVMIEGLRVEYPDGFGLVRASNSSSALVFRFEADNLQALSRIQAEFRKQIRRVAPRLQLPF